MTDLDRLRDAVVQAARRLANIPGIELQAEGAEEAFSALDDALAALDAHPTRATAETVRVAVWEDSMGEIMLVRPNGFRDQQFRDLQGHGHDCLGTTTLHLDPEAEG